MSKSFFYIGNSWYQLDFGGSTFDPANFEVINGVVTLKAGSITDNNIAANANIQISKIAAGFVKLQSDTVQVINSDIQLDSFKGLSLTNVTEQVNGISLVPGSAINIANLQVGDTITAGTTIYFNSTSKVPDFGGGTRELTIDFGNSPSGYSFQFFFLESEKAIAQLDNSLPGSDHILIMYRESTGGWSQNSFIVPQDVTVTANGLSSVVSHDDYWGFDLATVGLGTHVDIGSTKYVMNINSDSRIQVNDADSLAYMSDIGDIGRILDYINGEVI